MFKTPSLKLLCILFVDTAAILMAWSTSRGLRYVLTDYFDKAIEPHQYGALMPSLYATIPTLVLSLAACGLYRIPRGIAPGYLVRIFNGSTLGVMILLAGMFFFTRNMYSRSLLGLFWVSLGIFLMAGRWLTLNLFRALKAKGLSAERVAIIGTSEAGQDIAAKLHHRKEARFRFSGYIHPTDPGLKGGKQDNISLGVIADLAKIINRNLLDRIIIAQPNLPQDTLIKVVGVCNRMGVNLELVPDAIGFLSSMVMEVSDLSGTPLLAFRRVGFTRRQELLKRILDLAGSVAAGLVLLPPCALIAALIRIDSKGPVLFRQSRLGKGGKSFVVYKFRTMHQNAEQLKEAVVGQNETDGYIFKIKKDPRITRVGRLLRSWSLDEIPQLINVFRGEMSLVGPRPLPMKDLPEVDSQNIYQFWMESRETVMPGITGLWQIRGRSDLTFNEMVRLDVYYIENWSIKLDIEILLRTIPVVVLKRGAY
ncbi:sugar transferase [Acidobacteriota bacterium]